MYPLPISNLIKAFKKLPSIGQRGAERFVFYLLNAGKKDVAELTLALKELMEKIQSCKRCWNFSEDALCEICKDIKRDQTLLCIVKEPQDLEAFEKVKGYKGIYHVLRSVIKAEEENMLKTTKIPELFERLSKENIQEIILGLNSDLDGQMTMLYIEKEIKKKFSHIKVSRLARGLPMGSDLRYADEITLGSAIENRKSEY